MNYTYVYKIVRVGQVFTKPLNRSPFRNFNPVYQHTLPCREKHNVVSLFQLCAHFSENNLFS